MLENMSKAVRNVIFVMILIVIVGVVAKVSAQDTVNTTFQTSCYSDVTATDAHIHIRYTSDGVEHYTVSTDAPNSNLPAEFNTKAGTYELGWIVYTVDANFTVKFTRDDGLSGVLPIIISEVIEGECTPVTPYTPDPDAPVFTTPPCPASAVNQATLETYCYDPAQQPQNLSGAVVPVPPAP